MGKALYIAEKPSVAREFAKALKENMKNHDGYTESDHAVVTWCVGHLVTMSYPEVYDEKYRRWRLDTLPFLEHAIGLYRSFGFYDIPCYNDSPVESTIFMRLDLT